jgi:hypothetical protein
MAVGADVFTNGMLRITSSASDGSNILNLIASDVNGNVGVGTTAPGSLAEVRKDQNNVTALTIKNTTAGTSAEANLHLVNDQGTATLGLYSTLTSAFGAISPNSTYLYTSRDGGIVMMAAHASGVIKFATGGSSEKARIDSNGNVGIGTTTPVALLQLGTGTPESASTGDAYFSSDIEVDGRAYLSIIDGESTTLNVVNSIVNFSSASRLIISNTIATATAIDVSATLQGTSSRGIYSRPTLQSTGAGQSLYTLSSVTTISASSTDAFTYYGGYITLTDANSLANTGYGLYVDGTTANSSDTTYAIYSNSGTNYFGGNVGIADTTPIEATLSVTGTGYISSTLGVGVSSLISGARVEVSAVGDDQGIYGSSSGTHIFSLSRQTNDLSIAAFSGIGFDVNQTSTNPDASYAMYIKSDGNVGIGTTGPSSLLEVLDTTVTDGQKLVSLTPTFTTSSVSGTGYGLYLNSTNSNTTNADSAYSIANNLTDATSLANTNYALYNNVSFSGNIGKTGYGVFNTMSSSSTVSDTLIGVNNTLSNTATSNGKTIRGILNSLTATGATSGTTTITGARTTLTGTHAADAGTLNLFGSYVDLNNNTTANGTATLRGYYAELLNGGDTLYGVSTVMDADTTSSTAYGLYSSITATGTSSTVYGLYVGAATSGAGSAAYGAYIGGNVGIGTTAPNYVLEAKGSVAPKFALSDTGLASGITSFLQTDTYFAVEQVTDDDGGARLWGVSDSVGQNPLRLIGAFGNTDPTDTVPAVWLIAGKRSGTSITSLGNAETVLAISNNGTDSVTVLGSGNVGIGNTTPGTLLDIKQAASSTSTSGLRLTASSMDFRVYAESATLGSGDIGTFSNHSMRIFTNSTEKIRILADGNVGIGNTAPGAKLDVLSSVSSTGNNYGTSLSHTNSGALSSAATIGLTVSTVQSAAPTSSSLYGINTSTSYSASSGTLSSLFGAVSVANKTTSGGTVSNAYPFYGRCDSTGASGAITSCYDFYAANPASATSGVTTTAYGLYVEALSSGTNRYGIFVGNASSGTAASSIAIGGTNSSGTYAIYSNTSNASYFGGNVGIGTSTPSQSLQVNASGSSAVVITSAGFVGVGTTAPTIRFTATTSLASGYAGSFGNTEGSANTRGVVIAIGENDGIQTPSSTFFLDFLSGNGSVRLGTVDAQNGVAGVNYTTTSDRRMKQNIHDTSMSLSDLMNIQVRDYQWIGGDGSFHPGFIAQELYEVYPDAVRVGANGDMWGVDYGKVTPLIIKGVQELNQKVENALITLDPQGLASGNLDVESITISSDLNVGGLVYASSFALDSSRFNMTGALASVPVDSLGKVSVADTINALDSKLSDIQSENASQSAELVQARILGETAVAQAESLDAKVASTSANLASLSAQIQELLESTSDSTDSSSLPSSPDDGLTPPSLLESTGSATLAQIKVTETLSTAKLEAGDTTISGNFKTLDDTFLGRTTIAGDLSVDGTFSITSGNAINTLPILYLQNNLLAEKIDMFNGKVTVNKDGTIETATIIANQIKVNQNTSLGKGVITSGQTEVTIENSLIEENSIVLITPDAPLSQTLAASDIQTGKSFKVKLLNPETGNINFSYLIIGQQSP